MALSIGSLFSGIGGLELGLERAGLGPVKWQVEIDPFCRQVLARHWPDARRFDDIRSVGAADLEPVDLICGGFPCQDISSAGAKRGIAGPRSRLWGEFARVLRVARPRLVVVENVSALRTRGLDVVLGDLADLGFDAVWFPLAAADVGAPHLRKRMFVVGYSDPRSEPVGAQHEEASRLRQVGNARLSPQVAHTEGGASWSAVGESTWWEAEPGMGRVADGVPGGTHRLRALGNAIVPQVAEVVGHVVKGIAGLDV